VFLASVRDVITLIHVFVGGIAVFVQWMKYLELRNDVSVTLALEAYFLYELVAGYTNASLLNCITYTEVL